MNDSHRRPPASDTIAEEHLLGQYIPLHYHYHMLQDQARVGAFRNAIAAVVRPGVKVLELGGGTGILSYFAAKRAAKVWCVERNPALVDAARRFLSMNSGGERVEVVHADARDYLPPEPVDVVICEMLHVGLLREKQIAVLSAWKDRYQRVFGSLPRFIPEASLLAVQPVQQSFSFDGYYAPVPLFRAALSETDGCEGLGPAATYATIDYREPLPARVKWEGILTIQRAGWFNAVRLATKNLLAILVRRQRTIDWLNQFLVLPLGTTMTVLPGQAVRITLDYEPGAPLEAISKSMTVQRCRNQRSQRQAA